jgi:hypothetical protein
LRKIYRYGDRRPHLVTAVAAFVAVREMLEFGLKIRFVAGVWWSALVCN